jgi:hypothetical protein
MAKQKLDPALVMYLYVNRGLSTVDIARQLEVHKSSVSACLRKQGISKGANDENRDPFGRYIKEGVSYAPMKGERCYNWKGGEGVYRSIAFEYYDKVCVHCGSEKNIQIHHIDKNRKNNHPSNLRVVCASCHMKVEHPDILQKLQEGAKRYREKQKRIKEQKSKDGI